MPIGAIFEPSPQLRIFGRSNFPAPHAAATDTIDYVAADQAGNTATTIRTVIIAALFSHSRKGHEHHNAGTTSTSTSQ